MVTGLGLANANQYRRGVTYMPPVRVNRVRQRPVQRRGLRDDEDEGGGTIAQRIMAHPEVMTDPRFDSAPVEHGGGGMMGGLGFLINNPVTKTALNALSVLDYPRAAIVAGQRELLDVLDLAEAPGEDTGWDWGELWANTKAHKGFGELIVQPALGDDSNIWLRRTLGFGGDILSDPLTYLAAGSRALRGAPARTEYLTKLRGAQDEAARAVGLAERQVDELAPMLEQIAQQTPATGYGAWAQQAMGQTLSGAEDRLPGLLERQAQLGDRATLEMLGQRGVDVATPAQMEAMGIPGHGLRLRPPIGRAAWEIPGTERISRRVSRMTAPVKAAWSDTRLSRGYRKLLGTPQGEFRNSMRDAMERILTGKGDISIDEALNTIRLNQWARVGGSTFRNPATRVLNQLSKDLSEYSQDQIDNMVYAAETQGADNIMTSIAPQMAAAARQAGVRIPELQGGRYVMPHAFSREAFNFMKNLREGQNTLVDQFKRKLKITDDDLLEEGGFLQRRILRPKSATEPLEMKIGNRTVTIKDGSLRELEEELGGVLREAGFKGKLYETNPIEAWKKYVVATEKDVAKRYAARKGALAGFSGLHLRPGELPDEYFDPVEWRSIYGREGEVGGRQIPQQRTARQQVPTLDEYATGQRVTTPMMTAEGKPIAPELYEYRETKASARQTETRNKRILGKPKKGKGTGNTPTEILADYREAAAARRADLAERMDKLSRETWKPIVEERWEAREGVRLTGNELRDAIAQGKKLRTTAAEAEATIDQVESEIATLKRRIAATPAGARRRITAARQKEVADLLAETRRLEAERDALMSAYLDDLGDLPEIRRKAQEQAEGWVGARTEAETKLRAAEHTRASKDLRRQRRAVTARREQVHGKDWVTDRELANAEARIRDSPARDEYDALHEQLRAKEREVAQLQEAEMTASRVGDRANAELQQIENLDRSVELYDTAKAAYNEADRIERQTRAAVQEAEAIKTKIDESKFMRDVRIATRGREQRQTIENWTGSLVEGGPVYDMPAAKKAALKARVNNQEWIAARDRDPGLKALEAMTPEQRAIAEGERLQRTTLDSPEALQLQEARERLPQVEQELGAIPEQGPRPEVPELAWSGKSGNYEYKTPDGMTAARVEKVGKDWMTFYGRAQQPEGAYPTLKQAREAIENTISQRQQQGLWRYEGATRRAATRRDVLTGEQRQLQRTIEGQPALTSRVERAQTFAARPMEAEAGVQGRQQAEAFLNSDKGRTVEAARRAAGDTRPGVIEEPNIVAARARMKNKQVTELKGWQERITELKNRIKAGAPKGTTPERWKRTKGILEDELAALRREVDNRADMVKQIKADEALLKGKPEPTGVSESAQKAQAWLKRNQKLVNQYDDAQRTLARLGEREQMLPPVPTRDPRIVKWEGQAETLRGQAEDAARQQGKVMQRHVPGIVEAKQAVAESAGATAAASARVTPEAIAAEVAADPQATQRLAELAQELEAQGIKGAEAQKILDETNQAMTGWHNDYARALRDQGEARARHADVAAKTDALQRPQSAVQMVEGSRQARPYGKQLERVKPRATPSTGGMAPGRMWSAGGARLAPDQPIAYELQPLNRSIQDTQKLVDANPLGDDEAMNKIEALLHQNEQELAAITRENDLPAHELDKIIRSAKDGSLGNVLQLQLADGLQYLAEGSDIIISKEAQRIYFNAQKQLQSKLLGRYFTLYTDFFKTYATATPGFHFRNAMSAFFMNASEGVTIEQQIGALRLWKRYAKSADPVEFLRTLPDAERQAFHAAFGSGAGGQFLETGVSELRSGQSKAFEKVFANRWTRWNQRVGQDWVEGPARLALALDTTRRGGDVMDALNRVTRIHFDYGQVSQFDEQMKRIIPFWTFMSRNMPLQFTQMWTKPRAYLHYQSFARNFTMGATMPEFMPRYITQEGGLYSGANTPEGLPLAGTDMPIVLQPGMPFLQAQGDVQRFANAISGGPGGLAQVLSDVNPALTALPQYALAKDFFTGRQYGPKDQMQAKGLNIPIALALSLVGGAQRGADGNMYISENAYDNLKGLIPVLDRQSRLLPQATGESSDRQLESILRFLGIPVRTVSEDQMKGEKYSRFKTRQDQLQLQHATGG